MQKLVFTIVIFGAMLIPFFVNYIFKKMFKIFDLKLSDMTGMNVIYIIFYFIVNHYSLIIWFNCLAIFLNVMGFSYFYTLIVST